MGLLRGSASITRFIVTAKPEAPAFDDNAFRAIEPGSEVRESVGFVPMEPDADYRAGHARWAFRVRIDRLRPDPTAVRERLLELVRTEIETTGATFVGPKKRRQLKNLAEEELIIHATPRSKIIEACIDGDLLYVGSTAKQQLGHVLVALRKIGVSVDFKAPWLDRDLPEAESDLVEAREPGQSVYGCRFLQGLIEDRELLIEPESGQVRLQTADTRVTLTGAVLGDLIRFVERGAEVLSAKLIGEQGGFRLDGMSFRVTGLKIETERHDHWTELLDERLESIAETYGLLDRKFNELVS